MRAVVHPQPDAVRRAQGGVRRRHHVRHELRVRLRLPARQHGHVAPGNRPAQPRLRDRRRGRLDPHRRGADAAHHLRRAGDRGARRTTTSRASSRTLDGVPAKFVPKGVEKRRGRRGLRVRREVQDRLAARVGDRVRRARARDREPLRPAERAARQPPDPGAQGRVALPARRRLRRPGRRGQDRRRVHRPHHGGPALVGGPPPGGRGQGGRGHPRGARHARDDHAPELLPPLREALRHDRHGEDRGEGVPGDLQPLRRRDPDERRRRPRRRERLHLQDRRRAASTRSSRTSRSGTSAGQPVLVGTISVEVSEYLSTLLDARRASSTTS